MPVALLRLEVFAHRPGLRRTGERVAPAVLDFVERIDAAFHRQPRHGDPLVFRNAPAVEAGHEERQDAHAADRFRLAHLAREVVEIGHGGARRVRDFVRRHDLDEVVLARRLARGSGAGARVVRGGRGLLRAGVHVALVVEADVEDVLVALGSRGQALQADVVRAAVPREHDDLRVPAPAHVERPAQARGGGGARFERALVHGDAKAAAGLRPGDDRHAGGRDDRNGIGAEGAEHVARRERVDAAGAGDVPGAEEIGQSTHIASGTGTVSRARVAKEKIFSGGTFTPPTPARQPCTRGARSMP